MRIWNVQGRRSLTSQWLANVYFIIFMIELFNVGMISKFAALTIHTI